MKVYSGGPLDYPQSTLAQMFWKTVRDHAAEPGFHARPAKGAPFDRWTWEQTGARVAEIGNGLLSAGVKPGERVVILSETRVEWSLSDFGIFSAGGITVTVYPTLTGEQTAYLPEANGDEELIGAFGGLLGHVYFHLDQVRLRRGVWFLAETEPRQQAARIGRFVCGL